MPVRDAFEMVVNTHHRNTARVEFWQRLGEFHAAGIETFNKGEDIKKAARLEAAFPEGRAMPAQ